MKHEKSLILAAAFAVAPAGVRAQEQQPDLPSNAPTAAPAVPAAVDAAQRVRMQPLMVQGEHLVDVTDEFLMSLPALWQHLAGGCDVELRAA